MRAWLLTVGEPLPTDAGGPRLLRTGILAEELARRGHDVTWWTSRFDHVAKRHRDGDAERVWPDVGARLVLLDGRGYRRNVSLARIRDHREVAARFEAVAVSAAPPDVILASLPTVELAAAASRLGRRVGAPVVVDVRDMWPDAIAALAPRGIRGLARRLLRPLYADARSALSTAEAIVAPTEPMLDWALGHAGRARQELDGVFPMGYRERALPDEELSAARCCWDARGLPVDRSVLTICFFGYLGRQFDLRTVVRAARELERKGTRARFVLCGDGEARRRVTRLARGVGSVRLPGWVGAAEIRTLMERSDLGLAPYRSSWDFEMSVPNKPVEYLSAGLPVLTSLRGVLTRLVASERCGGAYEEGSAESLVALVRAYDGDRRRLSDERERALRLFRNRFRAEDVYGALAAQLELIARREGAAVAVDSDGGAVVNSAARGGGGVEPGARRRRGDPAPRLADEVTERERG